MKKLIIALALLPGLVPVQRSGPSRGPIIDVHLHAHTRDSLPPPAPNPATVSGSSVAAVEPWDAAAPDRILKGIGVDDPSTFMSPDELDQLFREKRLDAFGEVAAHADDDVLAYLRRHRRAQLDADRRRSARAFPHRGEAAADAEPRDVRE